MVEGEPPQRAVDQALRSVSGVDADYLARQQREALAEIARRRTAYLAGRPVVPVAGCTAIVVDDGIATGTTMRAALRGLRQRHPARLVLAVPVAPADAVRTLRDEVDDLVCLAQPEPFHAVGLHYRDFHQLDDAEVLAALAEAAAAAPAQGPDAARP